MRRLLELYFRFWSNFWLQEKTSIKVFRQKTSPEKSNIGNYKNISSGPLTTLRRLSEDF